MVHGYEETNRWKINFFSFNLKVRQCVRYVRKHCNNAFSKYAGKPATKNKKLASCLIHCTWAPQDKMSGLENWISVFVALTQILHLRCFYLRWCNIIICNVWPKTVSHAFVLFYTALTAVIEKLFHIYESRRLLHCGLHWKHGQRDAGNVSRKVCGCVCFD